MRALQYDLYGTPDVLHVGTVPVPRMKRGHVLVKIAASSVNAADVLVRSGKLRLLSGSTFPRGAGFDFTGTVVEVDDMERDLHAGDQVWGFLNGLRPGPAAATAEYVLAPVNAVALRPRSIDAIAAAALPGAAGAALGALINGAHLRSGERVLVRGAAGGVGTSAVQIARAAGAHVTALLGAKHIARIRELGAHEAYDYQTTHPSMLGGFDVILDPVAKNLQGFRRLLTANGRMVVMTLGGFREAVYWVTSTIFGKRRVRFVQAPPNREFLSALTLLVDRAAVLPAIAGIHSMEDAAAAHLALEAGGGFGKRVIRVESY